MPAPYKNVRPNQYRPLSSARTSEMLIYFFLFFRFTSSLLWMTNHTSSIKCRYLSAFNKITCTKLCSLVTIVGLPPTCVRKTTSYVRN